VEFRPIAAFELLSATERASVAGMEGVVDAYPLSELQQGMYFHSEMAPDSAVYHDVSSLRVELRFDEESFQRVLRGLVQRHAVLRTTFATSMEHRLLQLVHQQVATPLEVHDLSQLSPAEQDKSVHVCLEQE
jgi:microcystin synthetase protein McyA